MLDKQGGHTDVTVTTTIEQTGTTQAEDAGTTNNADSESLPVEDALGGPGSGNSPCFIATAAWGSPLASRVGADGSGVEGDHCSQTLRSTKPGLAPGDGLN